MPQFYDGQQDYIPKLNALYGVFEGGPYDANAAAIAYDPPLGPYAAPRKVEDKLRESVSPDDFQEGVSLGLVDGTSAVQKAIDAWALDRSIAIHLVGRYRIDGTLRVGNLETDASETRLVFHGGGSLIKNNPGFMFDKPVGQGLQTGHIFFQGIRFEGAGLNGETFILNGDNVIRAHFTACFGTKINIAKASVYLQSVYCDINTVWREWGGYLFDCPKLFDIRWEGTAEAGDAFLITRDGTADPACNALHVSGCIEGLYGSSGPMLSIGVCYSTTIGKLYCEGNAGGDIDAGKGAGFHKGLTIQGCGFQPHGDKLADPNYYSVVTGKGAQDSIVLTGNASTHNLFNVDPGNQSAIVDAGNWVAAGKKKFSPTSPRLFSFSGILFKASTLPGFGVSLDSYGGSVGFESTRTTVGGESVCQLITTGSRNPQNFPADYIQKNWVVGSHVVNSAPTIELRQYGTGVVHDALITGWVCMTSGTPGTWREISSMLPY